MNIFFLSGICDITKGDVIPGMSWRRMTCYNILTSHRLCKQTCIWTWRFTTTHLGRSATSPNFKIFAFAPSSIDFSPQSIKCALCVEVELNEILSPGLTASDKNAAASSGYFCLFQN